MRTVTTLILTLLLLQLPGQTVDTDKLQAALTKLQQVNSQDNQRDYFDLFPNSFDSFEQTFGYEDGEAAPLYDGHDFVVKFFSLDSIPKREQIEKWVNISIGGHWDADAVNYFQYHLRPRVFRDIDLTYDILSKRTEQEIESFFYFFFHEIHLQYETIPDDFNGLKNKDSDFYKLIVAGHKRAINDSGH